MEKKKRTLVAAKPKTLPRTFPPCNVTESTSNIMANPPNLFTSAQPRYSLAGVGGGSFGSKRSLVSVRLILSYVVIGASCFFCGLLAGMSAKHDDPSISSSSAALASSLKNCPPAPQSSSSSAEVARDSKSLSSTSTTSKSTFPSTLKNMISEYSTIPRDDFNNHFDIGVPLDATTEGAEDVLMLYMGDDALPTSITRSSTTTGNSSSSNNLISIPANVATENCDTMKVILHQPNSNGKSGGNRQCVAILPQWESYYVHKFMRLPKEGNSRPLSKSAPLRYVSRAHAPKGTFQRVPSQKQHTLQYYPILTEYLQNLPRLLEELKPIAQSIVDNSKTTKNTIVVLVCNYGQVELFLNFVCNARSKNYDLSNLLMFATDLPTLELMKKIDIAAYYDESIFGSMPETAAHAYGDKTFSKMMMAKVFCVHLINSLGYNILFQDVDVIWDKKHPLPYFDQSWIQDEWDLLFQDDGARSIRYSPYSPNTGFYYVKNNDKTQFFFSMLLRMGDVIHVTSSHQAALTALLNEHVSWKGIRIKVWNRGIYNEFPGGYEYHRGKDIMKSLMNGTSPIEPYIFHMSWTQNKANKKLYFEQMGEWYTKPNCLADGLDCCLPKPNITCHYRDKPSIIPCRDSPPIDKGRPSFW